MFEALGEQVDPVAWLDAGPAARAGRSILALAGDRPRVLVAPPGGGDPDAVLRDLRAGLAEFAVEPAEGPSAERPAAVLGWIGWFGYEWGAARLGVPHATAETPDASFLLAERAVVWDHTTATMSLHWLDGASGEAWAADTAAVLGDLADPDADPGPDPDPAASSGAIARPRTAAPSVRWRDAADRYRRKIDACQAAIVRGDAYQLCLTNRIETPAGFTVDPVATYLRLRRSSASHHGGFLRIGDVALLSASPEQFLVVDRDGTVTTKPMKGTRPRGDDPEADAALRAELLASDKERAENLMIVDLMRNDLGRVAELGTVAVPALHEVEEYPHVHQLVSTVTARLRAPLDALDAVAAAFPAGSMTGAPKLSAMRILHELEVGPRGVYSGAFGCLAVDGTADLAMTIRSIVVTPRGASIGTGGGITAASEAGAEVEETRIKARALVDAVVGRPVASIE